MLINGRENVGTENLKYQTAFIYYSWAIDHVYENLDDYNPTKKRRVLIVFDDMIADMKSNKIIKSYSHLIVFKRKKTKYFFFSISQSSFKVPKIIRLNALFHHENS